MEHFWDVRDKLTLSIQALPHNLNDLKDILITFECQIPQQTFRGLVESTAGQSKSAAVREPSQFWEGDKVIADWCVLLNLLRTQAKHLLALVVALWIAVHYFTLPFTLNHNLCLIFF